MILLMNLDNYYEDLLELLQIFGDVSREKSKMANDLSGIFDRFALALLQQAYVTDTDGFELPLNSMLGKIQFKLYNCLLLPRV